MKEVPSLCDVMVAVGSLLYIFTDSSEAQAPSKIKIGYYIVFAFLFENHNVFWGDAFISEYII